MSQWSVLVARPISWQHCCWILERFFCFALGHIASRSFAVAPWPTIASRSFAVALASRDKTQCPWSIPSQCLRADRPYHPPSFLPNLIICTQCLTRCAGTFSVSEEELILKCLCKILELFLYAFFRKLLRKGNFVFARKNPNKKKKHSSRRLETDLCFPTF
jgi:hypothetical protein